MRNKEKEKKNNKLKIILPIVVVVIVIAIIIALTVLNNSSEKNVDTVQKKEINMNAEAVVYYSFQGSAKATVQEDEQVFPRGTAIGWVEDCNGIIKKNGKEFSTANETELLEDGDYEITVTSPKNVSVTRKISIDGTPPEIELQKNSDGTYTILFKNINDVETAILRRWKNDDSKEFETIDLKEKGLQEKIEIKENGRYILECKDKVKNINNQKFKIEGK